MENELLKRLVAIIARFDQGIIDAPGNIGIDKPAIREAKLIINSDHDTSFVYDLNHNDAAEIVGQFSLYKKWRRRYCHSDSYFKFCSRR